MVHHLVVEVKLVPHIVSFVFQDSKLLE